MTIRRKSRADIEGAYNINSKSRVEDIINKEDTSAVWKLKRFLRLPLEPLSIKLLMSLILCQIPMRQNKDILR